jgi:hypothetical protein
MIHVTFICTATFVAHRMAEKMFAHQISQRGLTDQIRVTSAGTAVWSRGGADPRTNATLQRHGYPPASDRKRTRITDCGVGFLQVVMLNRPGESPDIPGRFTTSTRGTSVGRVADGSAARGHADIANWVAANFTGLKVGIRSGQRPHTTSPHPKSR